MRLANVPPPYALHEVEVSSSIIDVAITIRSNARPRILIGVLHHQGHTQFEWSLSSMVQKPPVCRFQNDFWSSDIDVITNRDRLYLQISFSGNSSLLFSKDIDKSTFSIVGEDGGHVDQTFLHEANIDGMVRYSWISKSKTYIMLDYDRKSNSDELEKRVQDFNDADIAGIRLGLSPFSMQRVDAINCDFNTENTTIGLANGTESLTTKDITFSLAENGSLFANDRRIARYCTSFLVTPAHLIFTTSQHLLKFVHLMPNTEGKFPLIQYFAFCSDNTLNRP